MFKRLFVIALFAGFVCVAGYGYGDQSKGNKVVIPVNKTNPTDGKLMYASYCAPCHGANGRGNGPVASSLKTTPTDLTKLARENGGKFPDVHIVSVLEFGSPTRAHGSAEMPVWGPILDTIDQGNPQSRPLRLANLSAYLKSIQAK